MNISIIYLLIKRLGLLPYFANTFCQLRDGTVTTIRNFHLISENDIGFGKKLFIGEDNYMVKKRFSEKALKFYVSENDFGCSQKEVVKIIANRHWTDPDFNNIIDFYKYKDTI